METRSFDASMRCDSCQGQAYHIAEKAGRAELLFCGHHMNRHHNALLEQGWEITTDVTGWELLREPMKINS